MPPVRVQTLRVQSKAPRFLRAPPSPRKGPAGPLSP